VPSHIICAPSRSCPSTSSAHAFGSHSKLLVAASLMPQSLPCGLSPETSHTHSETFPRTASNIGFWPGCLSRGWSCLACSTADIPPHILVGAQGGSCYICGRWVHGTPEILGCLFVREAIDIEKVMSRAKWTVEWKSLAESHVLVFRAN
jgi:hypothetical protein